MKKLEPRTATRSEAVVALSGSHEALSKLLARALASDGRIKGFKPDVAGFVGYLVSVTPIIPAESPCWRGERVVRCLGRQCSACCFRGIEVLKLIR